MGPGSTFPPKCRRSQSFYIASVCIAQCLNFSLFGGTFSDANWFSLDELPGTDGVVLSIAIDGSGSILAGGRFSAAGGIQPSNVAKFDGNSWSAFGPGVD